MVFELLNVVKVDSPKIRIAHPEKLTLKGGADDEKAYVLIKRRLARGGGLDAAKELSDAQLAVLVRLNKSLEEALDEAGRTEFPEAAPVIYSELGVVTRARRRSSTSQKRISVMTDAIEDEKTRKDVTSKDRAKKTKAGKLESPSLAIIEDPKRRGMATVPSASEAAEALRLRLAASAGGGGGGAAAAAGGGMSDGGRSSHARGASRDKLLPIEAHHTSIESSATHLSPSVRIRSLQKQLRLQDEVLKASKSESIEQANAEAKRAALTEELATLLRN